MTIIVFLIDTSASMNQRVYLGGRPTILDVAKGAVETFVKVRQRSPESKLDRYMLLTFDDPPSNVKAGWKENLATFMNELKNLQASSMTTMGPALKNTFDVLNINRMQTGIDTYGQGRSPFYLEPSVIVVITDGGRLSSNSGVHDEVLNLPMHSTMPGAELTKEPFRWDQRLFGLVLRLSGTPAVERDTGLVPSDISPIDPMCEVTGGRSYCITSHRMLMQCIDSLVQKVQSGVVLSFEKTGPDPPPFGDGLVRNDGSVDVPDGDVMIVNSKSVPVDRDSVAGLFTPTFRDGNDLLSKPLSLGPNQNGVAITIPSCSNGTTKDLGSGVNNTNWHSCRKLIYVPRSAQKGHSVGFWPVPESYWPEINANTLPPRSAHPVVKFTCTSQEPMIIENLPFDKYELEASPLTQFILSRKQPNTCWQVYVENCYKTPDLSHPFGYLKASTNLACVNLFVMPYNYPVLLPLLDDLFKVHKLKPTSEWKNNFNSYVHQMPVYYTGPLRRALQRMGATVLSQTLIHDNIDNAMSYSVVTYLKKLKNQAKIEYEKMCNDVVKGSKLGPVEGIRVVPKTTFKKDLSTNPSLQEKFNHLRDQLNEFNGFIVSRKEKEVPTQSYRNPYDILPRSLLDQVIRMRTNFQQNTLAHTKLLDEDQMHSMPVGQMGNYQEYLKRATSPLREIESTPVRQHMFGNPFKIDKRMMMVDEADIDMASSSSPSKGMKRNADSVPGMTFPTAKRKPGPLPRNITIRRYSYSNPPSPASPMDSFTSEVNIKLDQLNTDTVVNPMNDITVLNPDIIDLDSASWSDNSNSSNSSRSSPSSSRSPSRSRSPSPPREYFNHIDSLNNPEYELTNHVDERSASYKMYNNHASGDNSDSDDGSDSGISDGEDVKRNNLIVKEAIFKEVRKTGRNYQLLFLQLKNIRGIVDTRANIIREVINESLRFKRKHLASHLEKYLNNLFIVDSPLHLNSLTKR